MKWLLNLWNSLFGKKKQPTVSPQPAPAPIVQPIVSTQPTFVDNFSTLDPTKWTLSNWNAVGSNSTNKGTFSPDNASIVSGMLCLKMTQTKNADGTFSSSGAELTSTQKFGFGTYEFVVKASSSASDPTHAGSAVSGSITGCFSYLDKSVTEIDVEVEGEPTRANLAQFTSWILETSPSEEIQVSLVSAPGAAFHTYKYVWTATDITFYVDGVQVGHNIKVVPSQPANFLFNHYGTNNVNWGGLATLGTRYMFVKSFAFTPL